MIDAAEQPLKAMVLLGINCAFGNSDCGQLPHAALDLVGGWCTFPRPKTGIHRRCPLWPEIVQAVRRPSDCYRLERLLAGWDSHPLNNSAFARRTHSDTATLQGGIHAE